MDTNKLKSVTNINVSGDDKTEQERRLGFARTASVNTHEHYLLIHRRANVLKKFNRLH